MKFRCEIRTWKNIIHLSNQLAQKIKESGFLPDVIIALARGGWVPARIICDHLGVKDLLSLKVEHWGITATPDGKARVKYGLPTSLKGKNVLIVDDCVDTGESMKIAKEYVKMLGASEIKTASLQIFDSTPESLYPDFFVEKLPWKWIIYPWNYREDLTNLLERIVEKGEIRIDKIPEKLKEEFDVSISLEEAKKLLEEAQRRKMVEVCGDVARKYES